MGKLAVLLVLTLLLGACSSWTEEARYCYRTLGRVDCHATPLEGQEGRLVGISYESSD